MDKYLVDQIGGNTLHALELLVKNSQLMQRHRNYDLPALSDKGFLKEMCTVKLCSSRRTGHSTALVKFAYRNFNGAIFVTKTAEMARRLNHLFLEHVSKEEVVKYTHSLVELIPIVMNPESVLEDPTTRVYHFTSVNKHYNSLREIKTDAIMVDCSSIIPQNQLDNIYETLSPCMNVNREKYIILAE